MERKSPEFLNEQRNAVELKTESADIEINYSNHDVQSNPESINNSDAVILELVSEYTTIEDASKTAETITDVLQYKLIIKKAAQEGKPIFLIDISPNNLNNDITNKLLLGPVIEAMIANGLIFSGMKQPKNSRRDFLKLGAKSLMATHLSTPFITLLTNFPRSLTGNEPDEASVSRTIERSVRKLNDTTHPELRSDVIDTRNDLMAEKTNFIARMLKIEMNKRPRLSLFIAQCIPELKIL